MTHEKQIEILMAERCTKREAERFLKEGTTIFEAAEFEENFENYMNDWYADDEEIESYRRMIDEGIEPVDWSIAEYEGNKYYIMYVY